MLFSHGQRDSRPSWNDTLASETPIECFEFDRPLLLPDELHLAGAMAFATAFGLSGMTLLEWALLQTLGCSEQGLAIGEDFLTSALNVVDNDEG